MTITIGERMAKILTRIVNEEIINQQEWAREEKEHGLRDVRREYNIEVCEQLLTQLEAKLK